MKSSENTAFLAKISNLYRMRKSVTDKICKQILKIIQNSTLKIIYIKLFVDVK